RAVAVAALGDVLAVRDQPLAVEEAVDELHVVARGAHGERELPAVQADVQRLLDGDVVALATGVQPALTHPDGADPCAIGDPAHRSRIALSPAGAGGAAHAPPVFSGTAACPSAAVVSSAVA